MTPSLPSPLNVNSPVGQPAIAKQDAIQSISSLQAPDLKKQLLWYSENKFTGKLTLQLVTGEQWDLYLSLGRLIWATGGFHPVRRWLRQLWRCCPEITLSQLTFRRSDEYECWDYQILAVLIQRQISTTKAIVAAMLGMITEVLFDIIQTWELASVRKRPKRDRNKPLYLLTSYPGVRPSNSSILPQTSTWSMESAFLQIDLVWEQWTKATLHGYSPNFAPIIKDAAHLQDYAPAAKHEQLIKVINGQRTLRDLAILCQQDLLTMTCSLLPYINHQMIKLARIPDLPQPQANPVKPCTAESEGLWTWTEPEKQIVAACLIEAESTRQSLAKILSQVNYHCLAIADHTSPLALLLQQQPHLIFLDAMNSKLNGYDLCAKIRQHAHFQNTPIFIVADKNNMLDRMRSKLVKVTDFLIKPITPEKVIILLKKYAHIFQ